MSYPVKVHLEYNLWTIQRMVETIKPLEDQVFYSPLKSSFPGIAKTILHLWDSNIIWNKRLEGLSIENRPTSSFSGNREELLTHWISSSEDTIRLIGSKGDNFLNEKISYRTLKGVPYTTVVEDILFHIVNHATYHRGQIVTMLHEVGVSKIENTDLVNFLRTKGR